MNVLSFPFLLCIYLLLVEGRKSEGTHETDTSETRRVLGGKHSIPSTVKWVVRLRADTGSGTGTCTGALINARWVLTAAHCIHFTHNYCDSMEIYPSGWRLGDPGRVDAEQCLWHPKHNLNEPQFYDIALVKTKQDLTNSEIYNIMDLPRPGTKNCAGQGVTFYGFGTTEGGEPDSYAPPLLEANAKIIKWKDCEEEFKNQTIKDHGPSTLTRWIPKTAFCTKGDPSQNLGAVCLGDSGGPVTKDGILVGVISAALRSKDKACLQVSLHTSIDDHLRWIWNQVNHEKDTTFMRGFMGST